LLVFTVGGGGEARVPGTIPHGPALTRDTVSKQIYQVYFLKQYFMVIITPGKPVAKWL
jgi:hypothetical protein